MRTFLTLLLLALPRIAFAQHPYNIPDFGVGSPDTVKSGQTRACSSQVTAGILRIETGGAFRGTSGCHLTADMVFQLPGSLFEMGTPSAPCDGCSVTIKDGPLPMDATPDSERYGRGWVAMGIVRVHGVPKTSFARLGAEAVAGATVLSAFLPGSRNQDRLVVAGSRQFDGEFNQWTSESEVRTLVSSNGTSLTLNTGLAFAHRGARDASGALTPFLPHVGNLSRTVDVRSANPAGTRGHVLFTHRADVDVRYASFRDLGRTTTAPIDQSHNLIGRYSFHLHHLFGPTTPQANGRQFTVIGNVFENGTKWGVTVHNSHYGLIQDNVVYNTGGAGIMTEDGSETDNIFDRNFVVSPTGPISEENQQLLGRESSGLWLRGPHNIVTNNVVADSGMAYVVVIASPPAGIGDQVRVPAFQGADPAVNGKDVSNSKVPIRPWTNNEGYGSVWGTTLWDIGSSCCTENWDVGPSLVTDLKFWHITKHATYLYSSNNMVFEGWSLVNDRSKLGPFSGGAGWTFGDYPTGAVTIRNARIENCRTGFHRPLKAGDIRDYRGSAERVMLLENITFKCATNVLVTMPYGVTGGGLALPPSLVDIRRPVLGALIVSDMSPEDVRMEYSLDYGPNINAVVSQRVKVTDAAGESYDVYYAQQAPTFIAPHTNMVPGLVGVPEAGLTNAQSFAKYQQAVAGRPAPCTTLRPKIFGFACVTSTTDPDTDGDGVKDSLDKCPGTPPGSIVDANGCIVPPTDPDSDGDGVKDSLDKCPGTPIGTSVDGNGCTISSQATITLQPATRYQVIHHWEAAVLASISDWTGLTDAQIGAGLDLAINDLGISRARLAIRSGTEGSGTNFTVVNDNADPNVINPSGFNFSVLDTSISRIIVPARQRSQARGERFYTNLQYVGAQANIHAQAPAEYAEFMLAVFQHMQSAFGFVPDGIEIILEPDGSSWSGEVIGANIVATANRLQAAGFAVPEFIAPAAAGLQNVNGFLNGIYSIQGAKALLTEVSYHRYGDEDQLAAVAERARQDGKRMSMLEWWGSGNTYLTIHEDLSIGRNSAWQKGVFFDSFGCQFGQTIGFVSGVPQFCAETVGIRQYMKWVRPGAQRIGATGNAQFDPVAFVNADGKYVVVVSATGAGSLTVSGLPAGTYEVSQVVSNTFSAKPDVIIAAGQNLSASITDFGVLTIAAKVGGPIDPDTDGDGFTDSKDKCPTVPGGAGSTDGCPVTPLDSDGDGVTDANDKCPGTPKGTTVDANGCPVILDPDSDGDGIVDSKDKCPTQPAPGTSDGCPVVPPVTLVTVVPKTCTVTLEGQPPTTAGGWTARIRNAATGNNIGQSDSVAPYMPTAVVQIGDYSLQLRWTKSGVQAINYPPVTAVCK